MVHGSACDADGYITLCCTLPCSLTFVIDLTNRVRPKLIHASSLRSLFTWEAAQRSLVIAEI